MSIPTSALVECPNNAILYVMVLDDVEFVAIPSYSIMTVIRTKLAKSFYHVNYGSSIITSKLCQMNSVIKNINTGVSKEMIL